MPQEFSVQLPKVSTNAFNNFHYHKKAEMVREVHQLVAVAVKEQGIKPVEKYPVSFHFKFFFKSRLLDIVNCSSLQKCLEDALIVCNIIKDDRNEFVKQHTVTVEKDGELKEGIAKVVVSWYTVSETEEVCSPPVS